VVQYYGAYPDLPPRVSFTTPMVHYAINPHDFTITPEQYPHFATKCAHDFRIQNVCRVLGTMFEEPLHACAHCDGAFVNGAQDHHYVYVRLASAYAQHRLHHAYESTRFQAFQQRLFQAGDLGWPEEWFDAGFVRAVRAGTAEAIRSHVTETAAASAACPGVYSFACFAPAFCDLMVMESEFYASSNLPLPRPNSMNNHGLVLNSVGLAKSATRLQKDYFEKVSRAIFEEEGLELSLHHTFLVQYKRGEDLGLDMHTDDSDVTFNVCLGREFTGGELVFCGEIGAPNHRRHQLSYVHAKGSCVVHLGRQRHGAANIDTGERVNLIMWNRSLPYRSLAKSYPVVYAQESGAPDRICTSRTHDRDFGLYEGEGEGEEGARRTSTRTSHAADPSSNPNRAHNGGGGGGMRSEGWCPPPGKEHEGSPLVRLHAQQR
jgi:hypothetical protein